MKKLLLSALLLTNLAFLSPVTSYACSCLPPASPQQSLANSDVVFAGEVTSINSVSPFSITTPTPLAVDFNVSKNWKEANSSKITVLTQQDSAACGYAFEKGEEYIVYANYNDDGSLTTGLCSRTQPLSNATEDLQELGQPNSPRTSSTAQSQHYSIITVGAAILFITILVSASLKRR